jgi:hypothetical protein
MYSLSSELLLLAFLLVILAQLLQLLQLLHLGPSVLFSILFQHRINLRLIGGQIELIHHALNR